MRGLQEEAWCCIDPKRQRWFSVMTMVLLMIVAVIDMMMKEIRVRVVHGEEEDSHEEVEER